MNPAAPTLDWSVDSNSVLSVDGVRLETRCYGPPPDKAATIVLLHEGLGCIDRWKDIPQKLVDVTGHGVFVYSRQGYGRSEPAELPRPVDYMTIEAVDVLPKVLDTIGFESGVLMGHSDGASIASIYLGTVIDKRVRGLILIAPHFFTEPQQLSAIRQTKDTYEQTNLREKLARYHDDVDKAFFGWNDAWLNPDFQDWNISDSIEYWRVPVLVLQGMQDKYGSIAQINEIENRIYAPLDVVLLENCQHSPHLEQTDITLNAIADYLQRLTRIENELVTIPSV
ncbi:MAG: alpha/beta fold hydrolase [Granulosicoccus sp.]